MATEIKIFFSREIPVLNGNVQIVVTEVSQGLGTLTISSGNIGWLPLSAKIEGTREIRLTWQEFAELIQSSKSQKAESLTKANSEKKVLPDGIGSATSGSFQKLPMPTLKAELGLRGHFNISEFELIRKGSTPGSMNDRWFIHFDDSRQELFFHCSRTGFCIYLVRFQQQNDLTEICESWVNRDQDQYGETDIDYDVEVALWLIDKHLLRKHRDFPTRSNMY